jgi:Transposase, Mutator family
VVRPRWEAFGFVAGWSSSGGAGVLRPGGGHGPELLEQLPVLSAAREAQRRLTGVDEIVLSLYAKGLTTGEISAYFAEIYGASVSRETISRITDKVLEEMQARQTRPLNGTARSTRIFGRATISRFPHTPWRIPQAVRVMGWLDTKRS